MTHRIKNFETLATTEARTDALLIAEAGLAGVDTRDALRRAIHLEDGDLIIRERRYPFRGRNIYFVGIGKCALVSGTVIEELLGDYLTAGIVLDVSSDDSQTLKKIQSYTGTHPEPSEANVQATERIIELLKDCQEHDLVLILISGGGSTLLCLHDAPMTCLDEGVLFSELTSRGASIQELNTVRKHISKARGGGLAAAAFPAEVVALIISDVPGDDLAFVASGPTMLDTSTIADAQAVLAHYGITAPEKVAFLETPKEEQLFARVANIALLTSRDALLAMQAEASHRGYTTAIADDRVTGESRAIGQNVLAALREAPAHSAFLYAGESTVHLAGEHGKDPSTSLGTGGRNQEMALSVLADIHADELILPFSSDGHDNSDHAGAIADATAQSVAQKAGLSIESFLERHASYEFYNSTGDFLDTGYTGSNISDLIIALKS